jgi:hypothetical protein
MQFRLRTLLIVMAVAPLPLYWLWMPTAIGRRYVAAVNQGDYREADRLCADKNECFPGDWTRHKEFHPSAELMPFTWNHFLRGQRRVSIGISYGDGDGLIGCGIECRVTAGGIKVEEVMP